jgi:DNA-binding transcriptional regulator YhcF (GntR family)
MTALEMQQHRWVDSLTLEDNEKRILFTILRHSLPGTTTCTMNLSDIAENLWVNRSTVSRVARSLQEKGFLKVEDGSMTVLHGATVVAQRNETLHDATETVSSDPRCMTQQDVAQRNNVLHGATDVPIYSSSIGSRDVTEDISSPVVSTEEVLKERKRNLTKKKKAESKFYDWQHYDFGKEVWDKVRQGEYPEKENYATMVIGAYLLAIRACQELEPRVSSGEFNRYLGGARQCFEYFKSKHGDEAMNHVLKFVEWFCSQPGDTFIGNAAWSMNLMFTNSTYRDFEASGKKKPKKKAGFDENYQHRNNPIGKPILTLEDRVAWVKAENAKYDAKQAAKKAARKSKLNGPPNPDVPSVGTDATSSPEDSDDTKSAT